MSEKGDIRRVVKWLGGAAVAFGLGIVAFYFVSKSGLGPLAWMVGMPELISMLALPAAIASVAVSVWAGARMMEGVKPLEPLSDVVAFTDGAVHILDEWLAERDGSRLVNKDSLIVVLPVAAFGKTRAILRKDDALNSSATKLLNRLREVLDRCEGGNRTLRFVTNSPFRKSDGTIPLLRFFRSLSAVQSPIEGRESAVARTYRAHLKEIDQWLEACSEGAGEILFDENVPFACVCRIGRKNRAVALFRGFNGDEVAGSRTSNPAGAETIFEVAESYLSATEIQLRVGGEASEGGERIRIQRLLSGHIAALLDEAGRGSLVELQRYLDRGAPEIEGHRQATGGSVDVRPEATFSAMEDEPEVVFFLPSISGFHAESSEFFSAVADELPSKVVTVPLSLVGYQGDGETTFTVENNAEMVAENIQTRLDDGQQYHIVGSCTGFLVALKALDMYPTLTEQLGTVVGWHVPKVMAFDPRRLESFSEAYDLAWNDDAIQEYRPMAVGRKLLEGGAHFTIAIGRGHRHLEDGTVEYLLLEPYGRSLEFVCEGHVPSRSESQFEAIVDGVTELIVGESTSTRR